QVVINTVLPGVGSLVHVAVVAAALEKPLNGALMLGGRRAYEPVSRDAQLVPVHAELGGHHGREIIRCKTDLGGGTLDINSVLARPGGQPAIVSLHPPEPPDGVASDGRVGVSDMRRAVGVVDRSGEIVFHSACFQYARWTSASPCFNGLPASAASL